MSNPERRIARRLDLKSRGLCITAAAHGPATHGVLCEKCRIQHRGTPTPVARVSLAKVYPTFGPQRRRGPKRKSIVTMLGPAIRRSEICAVCVNCDVPVTKQQLDAGGPLYDICDRCSNEPIRERDHLFGMRGRVGVEEGNRQRSSKGNRT